MRQLRRTFLTAGLIAGLAVALASPGWADEAPYLTAQQVDISVLLPPPPPADGEISRAELAFVAASQQAASPQRVALAQADAEETVFAMFTSVLGDGFTQARLPKAAALFGRMGDTEDAVVDPAKKLFGRVRPWMASPEIRGIEPVSKSGSYPSGHTTRVTMAAIVLAQIVPEKRAALWARASEYAESRIVLGMHYPIDLEAGRRTGTAIATALLLDPAFRADMDAVRTEIRAGLGL